MGRYNLEDPACHAHGPPDGRIVQLRRDRVDAPPHHHSTAAAGHARRLTPPRRGRQTHNDAALSGRTTADWQPAAASEAGRRSAEVRKCGRPELCSDGVPVGTTGGSARRPQSRSAAARYGDPPLPGFPASRLPSSHRRCIQLNHSSGVAAVQPARRAE